MKKLLTIGGLAAGLMYFLDPRQGNSRRKETVQRAGGVLRGLMGRSQRAGQGVTSQASAMKEKVANVREKEKDLTDETLKSKVETEIFRDADAPKGQVDVNVIDGIVYLRGELEENMIDDLVSATRKVSGVKGVENLLHTPGTPAPSTPEGSGS